ncbi:MAG: hypothetical protein R2932_50505 [Caldilineaceae bacterium]
MTEQTDSSPTGTLLRRRLDDKVIVRWISDSGSQYDEVEILSDDEEIQNDSRFWLSLFAGAENFDQSVIEDGTCYLRIDNNAHVKIRCLPSEDNPLKPPLEPGEDLHVTEAYTCWQNCRNAGHTARACAEQCLPKL